MEINTYKISHKKLEKAKETNMKAIYKYEVADITVECPNCKLQYSDTIDDDETHYIECDRCGEIYWFKINW